MGTRGPRRLAPAVTAALETIRADLVAAEVVAALREAGVRTLLLKGRSIGRWLYDDPGDRPYVDCDLLVAPRDQAPAEEVLRALGFARTLGDEDTPGWRQAGHRWSRGPSHPDVDLHRTLTGVHAPDERLWEMLSRDTEAMTLGEMEVEVLARPARALHVALHAAQHGAQSSQPVRDFQRALGVVDPDTWREAAHLARDLEATGALAAGLRLTPAGRKLAGSLGLPASSSVDAVLLASTPPAGAMGLHDLAVIPGIAGKTRLIARKLGPTPRFMRQWSPLARRGRLGLAASYLGRPFWVVLRAPRGLAAWLWARRTVRKASGGRGAAATAQPARPPTQATPPRSGRGP